MISASVCYQLATAPAQPRSEYNADLTARVNALHLD
jgi:hypothetical protein